MCDVRDPYSIKADIDSLFEQLSSMEFAKENEDEISRLLHDIDESIQLIYDETIFKDVPIEKECEIKNYVDIKYIEMLEYVNQLHNIKEAL